MTSKKRALALLICLVMLLSLLPTAAFAAETGEATNAPGAPTNDAPVGDVAPGAPTNDESVGDDALGVPNDDNPVGDGVLDVPDTAAPAGGGAEQSEAEGALDPDAPNDDDHVGDGVLDVPNDAPAPVRVIFVCDPAETVVTVYDPAQPDEDGKPSVVAPEEDGGWLLVPGTYFYDAECEGYVAAEKVEFAVAAQEDDAGLTVSVELELLLMMGPLKLSPQAEAQSFSTAYPNTWTNTGNQAVDLAEVAYTQVGYTETDSNHTKYNQWYYGSDTAALWCAIFVSWCANQAGISQSVIHRTTYAYPGSDDFNVPYYSFSEVSPAKGDLIFVENNGNLNYGDVYGFDHVGIVYKVEGNTIYTVEGNDGDQVTYNQYNLSTGVDKDKANAYICWIGKPQYEESGNDWTYSSTSAGGVSARLSEVLASYPSGTKWTDSFDGGKQCYGFAKLVVYLVFGKNTNGYYRSWRYNGTSSSGMQIISQVEECTESRIKTLLSQARPGDVLQFDTGNTSGHQHSMVVYSLDSTGATIYECNWTKDTVTLNHLSFSTLANRQTRSDGTKRGTLSLLRSDNYDTVNGSSSTESTLQLSNANGPSGHYDSLDHFGLRGTFTSNYTITRVEAFVQNSAGTKVLTYNKSWNSTTYSIQNDGLNSAFSFGTLPQNDSYIYQVKATDASGKTCSFESQFNIGNTSVISGSVADRLAQVLAQFPDGSTWTESFDNSTQSYGFAGMVIYNVFGNSTVSGKTYRWWNYNGASSSGMNLVGQVASCTEANVQQLLSSARPGDVLQFNKGSNGEKQFSMIVYDLLYDNGTVIGAKIYDCNWDCSNSCLVRLSSLSNAQLAARQEGRGELSLLTSDNWESINGGAYQRPTPRYAVVYDANGGKNAPDNQTKLQGMALTLSNTTPAKDDSYVGVFRVFFDTCGGETDALYLDAERISSYSFMNWNTAQNGSGTSYNPGASYTADAAVTLYAQWTETTTTVSIDLPTPTREGYSFLGWAESSSAASGVTGSYTPSGDVTLYAIWQENATIPEDAPKLSVSNATARPNETVTLTVSLANNPGSQGRQRRGLL